MRKCLTAVFLKHPEKCRVKTRLAQSIGSGPARSVYRRLASLTIQSTDGLHRTAYCDSAASLSDYRKEFPGFDNYRHQSAGDLGRRMHQVFVRELKTYQSVVIIGSDCVQLKKSHIKSAYNKLIKHDVVIGPSNDGGYYLIGASHRMRRNLTPLFEKMAWGTAGVLKETRQRIQRSRVAAAYLKPLSDIDYAEDLARDFKYLFAA